MITRLKVWALILCLFLLSLPAFQSWFPFFTEKPLDGFTENIPPPDLGFFTWKRWFAGEFQSDFTRKIHHNSGFRNSSIRLFNQMDYSFFGTLHAPGFIEGKEGVLYEEDYIHEYTGRYFIGQKTINEKLTLLKKLFFTPGNPSGAQLPLILVFEGGKAEIYPEHIPERYNPERRTLTNRDYFLRRTRELGIPVLDLEPVLQKLKDTSRIPVFPKYGMHWSQYAAHFMADTISKYIGKVTGFPMPAFKSQHFIRSGHSLYTDDDIGALCNLIFPFHETNNIYPVVNFNELAPGTKNVLIIGDSYYTLLYETYGKKMFGKQDFWYYNHRLYPHQNETPPQIVDKSDLASKLKNYDLILLMVSDLNLHSLFWGFPGEVRQAFHPEEPVSYLEKTDNSMRTDRNWFRFLVEKSEQQKLPLEEVIRRDAEYVFCKDFENIPSKNSADSILQIRFSIVNNPDWYSAVKEKSEKMNIPLDEMLMLDAAYTYRQTKKKP